VWPHALPPAHAPPRTVATWLSAPCSHSSHHISSARNSAASLCRAARLHRGDIARPWVQHRHVGRLSTEWARHSAPRDREGGQTRDHCRSRLDRGSGAEGDRQRVALLRHILPTCAATLATAPKSRLTCCRRQLCAAGDSPRAARAESGLGTAAQRAHSNCVHVGCDQTECVGALSSANNSWRRKSCAS
jgi:hypothetical protein